MEENFVELNLKEHGAGHEMFWAAHSVRCHVIIYGLVGFYPYHASKIVLLG